MSRIFLSLNAFLSFVVLIQDISTYDIWNDIPCEEVYHPENCDPSKIILVTVDDFDRCGPAMLPLPARNYFLGASGRRQTYKENMQAFRRINILPKYLRDVSTNDLKTTILGNEIDFPIGLSTVAVQKLAHPDGELATVSALSAIKTILIMSSFSTTLIEDVAKRAKGTPSVLWMQTYIFQNRSLTVDIVQRAEKNGFKGIVLTADASVDATLTCNGRNKLPTHIRLPNLGDNYIGLVSPTVNFMDITWLKSITTLPIIVKGILRGSDAVVAASAGASAILVSNHGGRQMDGLPATIDALPGVVDAVKGLYPPVEVYMDGGVRSGTDVYKAIARGAKMVFVGRPIIWGLALSGSIGVNKMLTILRTEFNETMLLSGNASPLTIERDTVLPEKPLIGCQSVIT